MVNADILQMNRVCYRGHLIKKTKQIHLQGSSQITITIYIMMRWFIFCTFLSPDQRIKEILT